MKIWFVVTIFGYIAAVSPLPYGMDACRNWLLPAQSAKIDKAFASGPVLVDGQVTTRADVSLSCVESDWPPISRAKFAK
jgi:hypothetical protein